MDEDASISYAAAFTRVRAGGLEFLFVCPLCQWMLVGGVTPALGPVARSSAWLAQVSSHLRGHHVPDSTEVVQESDHGL